MRNVSAQVDGSVERKTLRDWERMYVRGEKLEAISFSEMEKRGLFRRETFHLTSLSADDVNAKKRERLCQETYKLTSVLSFRKGGNPNIRKVTSLLNRRF